VPVPARALAGAHAGYLVATGVWSLVHRPSFEAVAGRKKEFWLVRTVGGLAAATGATLAVSVVRNERPLEASALALGSAAVFVAADVRATRTESPAYWADLALQLVLAPAWIFPWKRPVSLR
jgi:hypothetical protein